MQHSETMKQQITPGLGKTKGDISEIRYGKLFKAQYRFTQKYIHLHDYFFAHKLAQSQKAWQRCIKKSRKHTS